MRINVTLEHILRGCRDSAGSCPVAIALIEAGFVDPVVLTSSITLTDGVVMSPDAVEEFVLAFDNGYPVQPFSFEIEVTP